MRAPELVIYHCIMTYLSLVPHLSFTNVTNMNIDPFFLRGIIREEIVAFNFAFDRLIICTNSEWELFSFPDLKSIRKTVLKHCATIIVMSPNSFVLANSGTDISVYSYDGTLLSAPRFDHVSSGFFTEGQISIACGYFAVLDNADKKVGDCRRCLCFFKYV